MLRQVLIRNFQSIRELQYDFVDGLNVIVAENGTGKSILNKIINFIVNYKSYTIDERKQYIRFNTMKSDIIFSSDNTSYWVEIFPNNINFYLKQDGKFVFESNAIPQGLISMLSLLISSNGFIGNLITSKQSKLLVDSSDDINTQVLSLVVNDEKADLLIETCEERLKEINSTLRSNIAVRDSLAKELDKVEVVNYSHVEEAVGRVFKGVDFVDNLVTISEILEHLNPKNPIDNRVFGALEVLGELENCYDKLHKIQEVKKLSFSEEDLTIVSNLERLSEISENIIYKINMIKKLPTLRFNENILGLLSRFERMRYSLDKVVVRKPMDVNKLKALEEMESLQDKLTSAINLHKVIEEQKVNLAKMKEELDSYGGEDYDCPIYGTIRFVNEECIRYNN